jgi:hypothetical protein
LTKSQVHLMFSDAKAMGKDSDKEWRKIESKLDRAGARIASGGSTGVVVGGGLSGEADGRPVDYKESLGLGGSSADSFNGRGFGGGGGGGDPYLNSNDTNQLSNEGGSRIQSVTEQELREWGAKEGEMDFLWGRQRQKNPFLEEALQRRWGD